MCEPPLPSQIQAEVKAFNQEKRRALQLVELNKKLGHLSRDSSLPKHLNVMSQDAYKLIRGYRTGYYGNDQVDWVCRQMRTHTEAVQALIRTMEAGGPWD